MGRNSGFISAYAALSQQEANFVLVPEMDFDFYGPKGLFVSALRKRLAIDLGIMPLYSCCGGFAGQNFFTDESKIRTLRETLKIKI